MTVVERVARREGVSPLELDPLYSVVEPDALDSLVGPDGRDDVQVTFTFHGHEVTVTGDGEVRLAAEATTEQTPM